MLETMTAPIAVAIALLGVALGFGIGRKTGSAAQRARELQGALEKACAERESLRAELDGYRQRVADHFTETSEKLHDLTLQYRVVYEHLAQGATELCPEGFQALAGGLGLDALAAGEAGDAGEKGHAAASTAPDAEAAAAPSADAEAAGVAEAPAAAGAARA